ncbi:MAG: hypothetical protein PSN34_13710 [Urechidicola sp.]|nr:hypothetical protein [Urechidicola sp.]
MCFLISLPASYSYMVRIVINIAKKDIVKRIKNDIGINKINTESKINSSEASIIHKILVAKNAAFVVVFPTLVNPSIT